MWVAHDKGFFKEEGLDVDLRPVQGIPDSQHPRHQWRKDGAIIFQSPGGSPPFRSVLENRDHIDGEVNVVSIANRTAHDHQEQFRDPAVSFGAGDCKFVEGIGADEPESQNCKTGRLRRQPYREGAGSERIC